jgi:hypothetical protein
MLHGTVLPTPGNLAAEVGSGGLSLHWSAVEGAGLYRVAVFDTPEKDGKRPLLAAVWVKGNQYLYGQTATVPKAGKFPSTQPLPLPSGHRLRAMVAAAASDGSDKGEWAGVDVEIQTAALAPARQLPTVLPSVGPTPALSPAPKEAELEVQGGEEFKQSPDAAVLEIDESGPEAGAGESGGQGTAALVAGAASAAAVTSANDLASVSAGKSASTATASPASEAKGLLDAGRFEQAETAYRAMLKDDPQNADAWEGLGDSYAGRRMKLEAKESYEKALELNKGKTHLKAWIEKNVRR